MWKIVIIDDDFQVVRGLRKAIPWEELDAEFAGDAIDGEAGLKLIEEVNPDIVLTDIYMPEMNGIQMIEALKHQSFTGRFVILSGYNDFEYARTALRLGVDDYLTKPVTVDQIRQVLAETIHKLEETYLQRLEQTEEPSYPAKNWRQEEWTASILNGLTQPEELPAALSEWRDKQFTVMVLEVAWTERTRNISIADWNLFRFAVANISEEVLLGEWRTASFVWLFGNYAAVLLRSEPGTDALHTASAAERLGGLIINYLKSYIGLDARFGLGRTKDSWQEIKASCDEALQGLLEDPDREQQAEEPQATELSFNTIHEKHRKAVQYMIEYVHTHYAEDITLEQLASQLYISKNYLNQLFKKVTGETFTNYVIRVRIEKAKVLLLEGKHLIYEVSEMVGYQNVPYFTTLFKKYCGVTPSELMKQ
ncbi:response regulator transcription factor [Paenibacillus sp. JDR-2]|uniref:response regulator transcription factor n=1 Tax=Paenibacillus sp. (strain JDR-2) TaxID=324057 RepID=UPI0001664A57|nr:response regulator transcription factor [Paenibacillus sp. JDR-2]ACT04139.1 two component transcriptional regulator, AraC family [Paenibacillus sp. JDR-2]